MRWVGLVLRFRALVLLFLLVFRVDESIMEGGKGALAATPGHELERGDLPRPQKIVAPRLVGHSPRALTAGRSFLRLATVVDALLDVSHILLQISPARLQGPQLFLDAVARSRGEVLGQAVARLPDLCIDLSN